MRNLKRALSLALASVMLLGMMVVGTSAASYPDVDENDNVEAIEVLNAVNVMIGRQGNFEPDEAVNRHEMAVIMAKLVLGVDTADNYVGTHPFTDVVPWADKYVAACYENGLVAGTSATTFSGGKNLTAVEAAAMMLRALGYKDLSVGATDWRAPITAMANQIRLFNGVASNPSQQLNRNQVAQLALNTLKSPMVNLKDNTISWSNDEGQIIMTGGSREYIALSSNEAYAKAINDTERAGTSASQISGYTVELGEHLYNGKLKLNNNNLDVFGRPSRKWEFDGKEIGSYVKEELMVMDKVGKVTGNDLYTLLGASTIKDYDTLVTIDGVANDRSDAKDILGGAYFDEADMNRNNKDKVGATGTGVLTQVFVDHEKDEVYVAVINTYLARAARDYDEKAEEATLTVYGIDEYRTSKEFVKVKGSSEPMKIQAEDFAGLESIEKDDPFLVTVADGAIQTIAEDEVLEGVTLTAFKQGDHVVSDGTEYTYTTTATYDAATLDKYTGIDGKTNLKDITYDIYLDAYGNLIGIKEVDAVKNYVFLAGIDVDGSNLYSKTATANALFLDGTSKTIKINLSKSKWTTHPALNNTNVVISGDALLNTWCTYTVSSDNVYTVTEVYATRVNPDHPSIKDIEANPNNYPGGGKNNTKLAQSWQPAAGLNEDNYTVDVKRMRLHGTTNNSDGSAYANVYGDSTSVYLTANLDELFNDSKELNVGRSYGIIKDVDAVTTGVADVSIKVMTKEAAQKAADNAGKLDSQKVKDTAYGIYTLYDSDGIVIASVVIGEDDGVKDLVYVHTSSLDLESYDSSADTWTWTRRVVFNGQETTLTEKGSEFSEMKPMKQFHWYEIKRNADGNVINVEPAWSALDDAFVYEYNKINTTVETVDKDTILYQTEDGPLEADDNGAVTGHDHYGFYKEKLNVIGSNTLAVETLTGSGIHFRDNVNVVLQYWNRNAEQTEIETGTGVDRLKSMVDFVNKNTETRDSAHPYYLSAVIEKGFATTIVIYDSYNSYKRPEAGLGSYELTLGGVLNSIYTTAADRNSDVYIVNSDGSITYVESNDDIATSTVNGYKRYTVPYGATIRIYDNDTANSFLPFFSPIKPIYSFYDYYARPTAQRAYIEFTVPSRLDNDKLTIRERMVTDGIYVGVEKDAKATITVGGKTYTAGQSVVVYDGQTVTANTTAADAKLYVNGVEYAAPYSWKVDVDKDLEFIINTTGGSVTPPTDEDVTVTFSGNAKQGDDYTVTGLVGGKIPAGGKLTITKAATNPVVAHCSTGAVTAGVGAEVNAGPGIYNEWTVTPDGTQTTINVVVNKTKFGVIQDADGGYGLGTVEDTSTATMARARMVRADIPQADGQWMKFTFVGVDGKEYTLVTCLYTKPSGVTAFWFSKNEDPANLAALVAAYEADTLSLEGDPNVTQAEKDAYNGGTTPAPVDGIWAQVTRANAGNTATFTKYDASLKVNEDFTGKPLTAEEIASALSAVKYYADKKVTFSADKVTIEADNSGSAIASDGSKVTFAAGAAVPTRVYKITYPGGVAYGAAGATVSVKDVTPGVKYLLDKKTAMGTGVTVTMDATAPATKPGTADFTVPAAASAVDVVYVPAMVISTTANYGISSGNVLTGSHASNTALTAWVDNDGDGFNEKISGTHLQVGAKITFSKPASPTVTYETGKAVVVKVATKTTGPVLEAKLTLPISKDLTIDTANESAYVTVPAWTADNGGTFTMVATIENAVDVKDTKIYVDNGTTALEIKGTSGSEYVLMPDMVDKNGSPLSLVHWDADNETWALTKALAASDIDDQDMGKVNVADLSAANEEGVVKVYRAYKVVDGDDFSTNKWQAYTVWSDAEDAENEEVTASANQYFRVIDAGKTANTIYVEGTAGVMLGVKGSKAVMGNSVRPVALDGATTGVWTLAVDRNIIATDIVAMVTFTPASLGVTFPAAALAAKGSTTALDINGIAIDTTELPKLEVKFVSFTAKDGVDELVALEKATFTLSEKSDHSTYQVTIKNGETAIDANGNTADDVVDDAGTIEITVNGMTVLLKVDRPKGT